MEHIKWLLLFILVIAISLTIVLFIVPKKEKILMSYWLIPGTSDVTYPIPGSLDPKGNIVFNQDMQDKLQYLDIIAYAFLHVQQDGNLQFNNSYTDLSAADNNFCIHHKIICLDKQGLYRPQLGNFSAFAKLTNQKRTLKKVISVGGGADPLAFTNAIAHMPAFVESAHTIIQNYHLDGIDLDFEPGTMTSEQITQYTELVEQLRKRLGSEALIMVTLVANNIMQENNWQKIAETANYIVPMCYNFYSDPHYSYTHYNNLFLDPNEKKYNTHRPISCNQLIQKLLILNIPSKKIIVSYASYGKIYSNVPTQDYGLFQPFSNLNVALPGIQLIDHSSIEYRIITQLLNNGFQEHVKIVNGQVNGVWAYNPQSKIFISYDNPQSIKAKAAYVTENNLAGLMTWLIAYDTPIHNKQSLLKTAYDGLNKTTKDYSI